jgi:glycine cleavage system H protein
MPYPSDLKYTKDHEWVRLSGDTAEVGITDYAQQQLGDVVFVELPPVGTAVTAGTPFGNIESVKAVSELFAPVTGQIVEVNDHLAKTPEDLNVRPHETWMVRIRLQGIVPDGLLDSAQYEALLA